MTARLRMPCKTASIRSANCSPTPRARHLFGNRGGRIHSDDRTLTKRRWASRQWICCVLDFKNRQRDVWGRYYTELFFLDEVTALAAGHRPCFECRREDAEAFADRWRGASSCARGRAPGHGRGAACRAARRPRQAHCIAASIDDLPDGAMIALDGERLRGARRRAAALDAVTATARNGAAARHHRRCADAAGDPGGARGRLSAAMAPERRTSSLHRGLDRLDALAGFRRAR